MISPSSITTTLSAYSAIKSILCSTSIIVLFCDFKSFKISKISSVPSGSSWLVGSSNINTLGFITMIDAIATLWDCPPDNSFGFLSCKSSIFRSFITSDTLCLISSLGTPKFSSPYAISSNTVFLIPEIWLNGFWNTNPTNSAISPRSISSMFLLSMMMSPVISPWTKSGIIPLIILHKVVLPEPFLPIIPTNSPCLTYKSKFFIVFSSWSSYLNETFLSSIII